jgi:hypothetical protein
VSPRASRPEAAVLRKPGTVDNTWATINERGLASRLARRKSDDIENVLISDFQVKVPAIGQALSKFFNVPYEPFKPDRVKRVDLLKNLKREFVQQSQWLPIEDGKEGLVILATDPEQLKNARMINTILPKTQLRYRVTTNSEFRQTVDQFFGIDGDNGSVGDLLSGMEENDEEGAEVSEADISAAAENELVKLVNKIIVDACRQGASDIHIEPRPGKEKTMIQKIRAARYRIAGRDHSVRRRRRRHCHARLRSMQQRLQGSCRPA